MPEPIISEPVWAQMRHIYETTDISLAQLAASFGFRSKTSVLRKKAREGWRKNVDAIAADMARTAVAIDAEIAAPPPPVTDLRHATAETSAAAREAAREEFDVAIAANLAKLQAAATREQLSFADRTASLGLSLVEHLQAVLTSDDEEARREAIRRLSVLNPINVNLANLLKVASALLEGAATMRRRALGMDAKLAAPEAKAPERAQPMEAVMRLLPNDTLMALRRAAQEVARLPAPKEATDVGD